MERGLYWWRVELVVESSMWWRADCGEQIVESNEWWRARGG